MHGHVIVIILVNACICTGLGFDKHTGMFIDLRVLFRVLYVLFCFVSVFHYFGVLLIMSSICAHLKDFLSLLLTLDQCLLHFTWP